MLTQETGATRVRRGLPWAAVGPALALQVVLGVVVGVLWWWLAPTAEVVVVRDIVVAPDLPELQAAQDGTFALLALGAGLLSGAWLTAVPGRRVGARAAAVVAGGLLGSVLAWSLGVLLGGPSVGAQVAAGDDPLVSSLHLTAYGALGVWPAVAAAVAFVGLLLTGLLTGRQRR